MSAPSLDVLRIQAEHIRQQADALREHLDSHAAVNNDWSVAGHLETAVSCSVAIEVLAQRVHACITCAIEAQKPLPVCAGDKPEPRVGDWFRMPLYNGEHADAVVHSCVAKGDGAVEMEMLTKCGETLRGIWSRAEWQSLRRIPKPQPTGGAA